MSSFRLKFICHSLAWSFWIPGGGSLGFMEANTRLFSKLTKRKLKQIDLNMMMCFFLRFSNPIILGSMETDGNDLGRMDARDANRLKLFFHTFTTCCSTSGKEGAGPQRTHKWTFWISSTITYRNGTWSCKQRYFHKCWRSENNPLTVGLLTGRKTGVSFRVALASTME